MGLLCEHAVRGLSQVRPIGMGSGCEMWHKLMSWWGFGCTEAFEGLRYLAKHNNLSFGKNLVKC